MLDEEESTTDCAYSGKWVNARKGKTSVSREESSRSIESEEGVVDESEEEDTAKEEAEVASMEET